MASWTSCKVVCRTCSRKASVVFIGVRVFVINLKDPVSVFMPKKSRAGVGSIAPEPLTYWAPATRHEYGYNKLSNKHSDSWLPFLARVIAVRPGNLLDLILGATLMCNLALRSFSGCSMSMDSGILWDSQRSTVGFHMWFLGLRFDDDWMWLGGISCVVMRRELQGSRRRVGRPLYRLVVCRRRRPRPTRLWPEKISDDCVVHLADREVGRKHVVSLSAAKADEYVTYVLPKSIWSTDRPIRLPLDGGSSPRCCLEMGNSHRHRPSYRGIQSHPSC